MKRLFLVLTLFLLCGCQKEELKKEHIVETKVEEKEDIEEVPEDEEYIDSNPIRFSFYVDNPSDGLDKVENEYRTQWILKKDIVVLGIVYSDAPSFGANYFQNIFRNEGSKYENYESYKIGWHLNFELQDGTVINQYIYKPSDAAYFYDYLEIYLYDSVHVEPGVWYSHTTDEQMTQETIFTSMKLTAGSKFNEIVSPIKVTAFTYNNEEEFDEEGNYRGSSIQVINVINTNI